MSEEYEISKQSDPVKTVSDRVSGKISHHQKKFTPSVGPLSDPWQFRIYLDSLTIRKNNV
jgi:hypothetical protein